MPRIGQGAIRRRASAALQIKLGILDRDVSAQLVHRQAFNQPVGQILGHIQQHRYVVPFEKEIGQILALWGQEGGVDKPVVQPLDIICDQPLQKAVCVLAGQAQNAAIGHGLILVIWSGLVI